jgi:hypothetical protein
VKTLSHTQTRFKFHFRGQKIPAKIYTQYLL